MGYKKRLVLKGNRKDRNTIIDGTGEKDNTREKIEKRYPPESKEKIAVVQIVDLLHYPL